MEPFGQTVLLWRLERGLKQKELAYQAGLSRPNLSAIERGKREVNLQTLRRLALALEIRPGILADGIAPSPSGIPQGLTRQTLDRIADAVIYGKALKNSWEQKLASRLKLLVQSKNLAAGIQIRPKGSKRLLALASLELSSNYSPKAIQALLRRIADRQRLQLGEAAPRPSGWRLQLGEAAPRPSGWRLQTPS